MLAFARARGLPTGSDEQLDVVLNAFAEREFLRGVGSGSTRFAIFGTAYMRDKPSRDPAVFPLARRALAGFGRRVPAGTRDPPPLEAVWVLADRLLDVGSPAAVQAAAFTLLAFDCYLRPSEGLWLERRHVNEPLARTRNRSFSLVIAPQGDEPAKNNTFDAGVVAAFQDRPFIAVLLRALVCKLRPQDRLFDQIDLPQVELLFRQYGDVDGVRLDPHSLRHGGPSHDFHYHGVELASIQARGRWHSAASVRRYSKPAMLLRQLRRLTPASLELAKRAERSLPARLCSALRRLRAARAAAVSTPLRARKRALEKRP